MKKLICIIIIFFNITIFANNKDNSFEMEVDAISLSIKTEKNYYIRDLLKIVANDKLGSIEQNKISIRYYPEVVNYLEKELENQGYKKHHEEGGVKIAIYYSLGFFPKSKNLYFIPTPFHKDISIEATSVKNEVPLWETKVSTQDDNSNLRIYIPSMIKCSAPYFNKNFKGTITCQR